MLFRSKSSPVDIFVVGDISTTEASGLLDSALDLSGGARADVRSESAAPVSWSPREILEEQRISQGKLTMGFRTSTTLRDEMVFSLIMFDGLLGAFPHSKLFMNVREKEGLAYYAQSMLDNSKGIMLIVAGVDPANYNKAVDLINAQVESLRKGEFSDDEMEATRNSLLHRIRASEDSVSSKTSIFYEYALAGNPKSMEERMRMLEVVTREHIIEAASKVQLDTVFFLGPEGGMDR